MSLTCISIQIDLLLSREMIGAGYLIVTGCKKFQWTDLYEELRLVQCIFHYSID